MHRLPEEKEYEIMFQDSNKKNLNNLKQLLPSFFLKPDDEKYLIDRAINKIDVDNNLYLDKLLNLNTQRRAFYDIASYDASLKSYETYCYTLRRSLDFLDRDTKEFRILYDNFTQLKDPNTFKSGFIKIGKQKFKLFKFLLKNKILTQDKIEEITSARASSDSTYLCLSRNPIDYLFCSTGQSYTSCLNLYSDYSGLMFLGLPGIMHDPNRILAFVTNGKYKKKSIKNLNFKYFSMINRSWALLLEDDEFFIVREYPNDSYNYRELFNTLNIKACTYSDDSKFTFKLLHHETSDPCMIYLDNIGIDTYNPDKSYYTRDGRQGNLSSFDCCLDNGIDSLETIDDLEDNRYVCEYCDCKISEEDAYSVHDIILCESCFNEAAIICDDCGDPEWSDDSIFVNDKYGRYVCRYCSENYEQCDECGGFYDEDNIEKSETQTLCTDCLHKYYITCEICEEFESKIDSQIVEDCEICKNCFMNSTAYCKDCGERFFTENLNCDGICNNCEENQKVA